MTLSNVWNEIIIENGEGNGNPLQYSCLENPRDGGALWAAISGVAQSRTWLKRLSSSSSSLQWTTFCQTSPPWPTCLGWPHRARLSFIELDKGVVLVWLDWLVFCDYGFSVSALWCPFAAPTVLLGFLLPWMWGISSRLLQQSTPAAPDLERGVAPLGPPVPEQPPLLGCGVAPLSHCPWPQTWGISSWPLLRHRSLALSAMASDLRHSRWCDNFQLTPYTSCVV